MPDEPEDPTIHKISRETFSKWRENSTGTSGGEDFVETFKRLRERHLLERDEPLYAALVSARWASQSVWGDWSAINMTMQPFLRDPKLRDKWRGTKDGKEWIDSMEASCKRLWDLGKKCDERVETAEAEWRKREAELKARKGARDDS